MQRGGIGATGDGMGEQGRQACGWRGVWLWPHGLAWHRLAKFGIASLRLASLGLAWIRLASRGLRNLGQLPAISVGFAGRRPGLRLASLGLAALRRTAAGVIARWLRPRSRASSRLPLFSLGFPELRRARSAWHGAAWLRRPSLDVALLRLTSLCLCWASVGFTCIRVASLGLTYLFTVLARWTSMGVVRLRSTSLGFYRLRRALPGPSYALSG